MSVLLRQSEKAELAAVLSHVVVVGVSVCSGVGAVVGRVVDPGLRRVEPALGRVQVAHLVVGRCRCRRDVVAVPKRGW